MNPGRFPPIGTFLEFGPEDPVFGLLLLAGPAVVALIAASGRTPLTLGITAGYVVFFFSYVLYRGTR
ncbi:MAG: hypothetical protein MAG715_00714 [Methanonatronarchaeales archaeon]|nr:hypothetical protein [Methanonatronarchaeales archaeon]